MLCPWEKEPSVILTPIGNLSIIGKPYLYPYEKGFPMGYAEVISLDEVRASKQWELLRQQLHARFDQWLDRLQEQLPGPAVTLAQVTETVWNLRQELTGDVTGTILTHAHRGEQSRQQAQCAQCERPLQARPAVARTVEAMVRTVQYERPYTYKTLSDLTRVEQTPHIEWRERMTATYAEIMQAAGNLHDHIRNTGGSQPQNIFDHPTPFHTGKHVFDDDADTGDEMIEELVSNAH